jgi:quercetin dioxygenase-like cupin family protein
MDAGGYAEAHAHPGSSHVIYLLEGRLEVTLGDARPVTLEPGGAVLIPEGLAHATRTTGDVTCAYVIVTAPPAAEED